MYVDELGVGLHNKSRDFVIGYLARLDAIETWFSNRRVEANPNLSGEKEQFASVQRRFIKNAASILPVLGGEAGLQAARPEAATEVARPWWFIDQHLFRQKQQRRKLIFQSLAAIGLVLILAAVLMTVVFKPDFVSTTVIRHADRALAAIILEQDYQTALTEVDQALAADPDNLRILVLKSIILEHSGQPVKANRLVQQAYRIASIPEQVPYERGQYLMQTANFEAALAEAERTIDLNPNFAEGWLLKGQIHDRLHQIPYAFDAMSIAAELAVEQEKYTLEGLIRFNIENLANSAGGQPDASSR